MGSGLVLVMVYGLHFLHGYKIPHKHQDYITFFGRLPHRQEDKELTITIYNLFILLASQSLPKMCQFKRLKYFIRTLDSAYFMTYI